ncbi:uncharacterized protein LOC114841116 [Diachasma alloeum]|uniref:Ionotropic receptor 135 n=1 Tax=Diachasma alloeum TaxID=454923 RepID=A0A4E0RMH8_9HYME|nr:uncharacterized protein LOC114841116 [Diachasma alloeum]THK32968.1 ionotropic receptor 135 [Diachasma alloeum]
MCIIKTLLVIFLITILVDEIQSRPEVDWFDSVATRLFRSGEVHTVLIIHQRIADYSDVVKNELFGKIMGTMPSVIVEVDGGVINLKEQDFGVVSKNTSSLLFIFYADYSGDNVQIYEVMHAMKKLTDFSVNYILIVLRTSSNLTRPVENILQYAWDISMSNILIVEIRRLNSEKRTVASADNTKVLGCGKLKCYGANGKFNEANSVKLIMHQFNFFSKQFFHEEFHNGVKLFPNFAKNMHGYVMKSLGNYIWPLRYGQHKDKKKSFFVRKKFELYEDITRVLNFTTTQQIFLRGEWKGWRGNYTYGALLSYYNKTEKVDIMGPLSSMLLSDLHIKPFILEAMKDQELIMVMPTTYAINQALINKALASTVISLIIFALIWLVAIILNFDGKIWSAFAIFSALSLMVVHHQPLRTNQRMLFLAIVVVSFMYSNDIYASLINLGIDPFVENEYETFEQIDDSCSTPMMQWYDVNDAFVGADGAKLNLKKKHVKGTLVSCLEKAVEYRNVCCLTDARTMYASRFWLRRNNGLHRLKVAKPIFASRTECIWFREGIPGKREIIEVIKRLQETGLSSGWYSPADNPLSLQTDNHNRIGEMDEESRTQLLRELILLGVLGYSLAITIFIGELLVHRFGSSAKGKMKLHLPGVPDRKIERREW